MNGTCSLAASSICFWYYWEMNKNICNNYFLLDNTTPNVVMSLLATGKLVWHHF